MGIWIFFSGLKKNLSRKRTKELQRERAPSVTTLIPFRWPKEKPTWKHKNRIRETLRIFVVRFQRVSFEHSFMEKVCAWAGEVPRWIWFKYNIVCCQLWFSAKLFYAYSISCCFMIDFLYVAWYMCLTCWFNNCELWKIGVWFIFAYGSNEACTQILQWILSWIIWIL